MAHRCRVGETDLACSHPYRLWKRVAGCSVTLFKDERDNMTEHEMVKDTEALETPRISVDSARLLSEEPAKTLRVRTSMHAGALQFPLKWVGFTAPEPKPA